MLKANLENLLSVLGPSTIEKMNISIPNDMISMDITTHNSINDNKFRLVFEEVFSFYFVNTDGTLVKKSPLSTTQLNSIMYYKDGAGEFANMNCPLEELTDNDISLPNFALELLNSSMFIEARSIKINDKKFKLDYPII